MPKFNKTVNQLETRFEKWLYVLKNLHKLERVPPALKESIFEKVFKTAEIAKFTPKEHQYYIDSLKYYRDLKNSFDTAREEGRLEGREEGRVEGRVEGEQIGMKKGEHHKALEIAKNLKLSGLSTEMISKATGLSDDEIEKL